MGSWASSRIFLALPVLLYDRTMAVDLLHRLTSIPHVMKLILPLAPGLSHGKMQSMPAASGFTANCTNRGCRQRQKGVGVGVVQGQQHAQPSSHAY